jgi:hypothetical protein
MLASRAIPEAIRVNLLGLLRRDDADLVVIPPVLTTRIGDGVDMKTRGLGLAGQLAEPVDQHLLQVVGEVVLSAEEDNAALRD